jgi:hypothetical protein
MKNHNIQNFKPDNGHRKKVWEIESSEFGDYLVLGI